MYHNWLCSLRTGTICGLTHNTISEGGNVITFNKLEDFTQSNLTWVVTKVPYKQFCHRMVRLNRSYTNQRCLRRDCWGLVDSPLLTRPVLIWLNLEGTNFMCPRLISAVSQPSSKPLSKPDAFYCICHQVPSVPLHCSIIFEGNYGSGIQTFTS